MKYDKILTLLSSYRANDWRLSFVPFILACVCIWIFYFDISFSINSFLLFLLSLVTTLGFTSLGYFLNEYYDKDFDKKAGKTNRLSFVKTSHQLILFIISLLFTFLPWVWLPSNKWTWIFITSQILCYFIYSHPFIRAKEIPGISNIIDALYAYTIPAILSHYTYARYAGALIYEPLIITFLLAMFIIGLRNIIIHQVKDMFYDKLVNLNTLPMLLGVKFTNMSIVMLQIFEIIFFSYFLYVLSENNLVFTIFLLLFLSSCCTLFFMHSIQTHFKYYAIKDIALIPNKFYHVFFPIMSFGLVVYFDSWWLTILPLVVPFVNFHFVKVTAGYLLKIYHYTRSKIIYFYYELMHYFGYVRLCFNYLIYYFFLLFRVNLKEKNMSAFDFIKTLFK